MSAATKTLARIWLTFALVGATTHLVLWVTAYLAVISTWSSAAAGYGWSSLASNLPGLAVAWLWHALSAGLAGVAAVLTARRLPPTVWLLLVVGVGGGLSGAATALAGREPAAIAQAALLGALGVAVAALATMNAFMGSTKGSRTA